MPDHTVPVPFTSGSELRQLLQLMASPGVNWPWLHCTPVPWLPAWLCSEPWRDQGPASSARYKLYCMAGASMSRCLACGCTAAGSTSGCLHFGLLHTINRSSQLVSCPPASHRCCVYDMIVRGKAKHYLHSTSHDHSSSLYPGRVSMP